MKLWLPSIFLYGTSALAQLPFINELHYDNDGSDTNEGVEIAALAGLDLEGYRIDFYNGNGGAVYMSEPLSGVVPDLAGNGFGAIWFAVSGIQNGAPDALALVDPDGVILEAISYEGTQLIEGITTRDIGVEESNSSPVGLSLGLVGTGRESADFTWADGLLASPGALNPGQTATGDAVPRTTLTLEPLQIEEGAELTLTLSLQPPPESAVTVGIAADPDGRINFPESILVDTSGEATLTVSTNSDGVPAGASGIIVSVVPEGDFPSASTAVVLTDAEEIPLRETSFRLAALNVENGTGSVGSRSFEAVVSLLKRIDADVVGLEEVEDGFAELAAAGELAGYPFIGFGDDRFLNDFDSGEFGSGQNLAVLSRYPITERLQIGRDDGNDVLEHTRFPLFVRIDVPGLDEADDPAIVVAHYKASGDDASSYRRALETFRTVEFLQDRGLDGADDNVFVVGDLNEDVEDFQPLNFDSSIGAGSGLFSDGSTLPVSFTIGSDLVGAGARTLLYRAFPRAVFAGISIREQSVFQVDGIDRTRSQDSPRRLDYILVPDRVLAAGNAPQEVFNSLLETSSPGLPKAGLALAPATSRDAADHQIVFGDFELLPRPAITVATSPDSIEEGGDSTLTIEIPASDEPITVTIAVAPFFDAVAASDAVTFAAGETIKTIPVASIADSVPAPDQGVVFAATATGYSTGYATLDVRNFEAQGDLLFTQVSEQTGTGSNRLAIEITNISDRRFNFLETPFSLRSYPTGSQDFIRPVQIEDGFLEPGGVVVIGEESASSAIFESPVSATFDNSPFFDETGQLVFVFTTDTLFDGNEAQEVLIGQVRQDVFGRIGEDPGVAWTGGGVTTRNDNIERLPYATSGSSGWSDPSLRFSLVEGSDPLAGIGVVPDFDPDLDSDGDGFSDFLEFAAGTLANDPDSEPIITSEISLQEVAITHSERENPGIIWNLEMSSDLTTWTIVEDTTVTRSGTTTTRSAPVVLDPPRVFYRLRVTLE